MDELRDSQNSMDPHDSSDQGKFGGIYGAESRKKIWEEPKVGLDPQGRFGLIPLQEILWELLGFQRKFREFGEMSGKGKIPNFGIMDSVGSRNGLE